MNIITIPLHIFYWFLILYLFNGLSFVTYSFVMLFLELSTSLCISDQFRIQSVCDLVMDLRNV